MDSKTINIKKDLNSKIKITQIGSCIGQSSNQKRTLVGLGLNKIGAVRVFEFTASIKGMVEKVKHLVRVETLK